MGVARGLVAAFMVAAVVGPGLAVAAASPAQAAEPVLTINRSYNSINGYVGLTLTAGFYLQSNVDYYIDDAYVTLTANNGGSDLTLPSDAQKDCAQPAGRGGVFVCGPYKNPARGTGASVSDAPEIPHDYFQ